MRQEIKPTQALARMFEFAPKNQTIYVSDSFFDELSQEICAMQRYCDPQECVARKYVELVYLGITIRNTKHPERPKNPTFKAVEVQDEAGN